MFAVGIFVNMMLVSIFPYQFLSAEDASALIGADELGYNFDGNGYFTEKHSEAVGEYQTLSQDEQLNELTDTEGGIVAGALEAISSFFDGLLDGITKIKQYLAFIIPFAAMFFLLPGAFGIIFGTMYSVLMAYSIIRWIRGA